MGVSNNQLCKKDETTTTATGMLQVKDLVTLIIPLREVTVAEKVDNSVSGNLINRAILVTIKNKVSGCTFSSLSSSLSFSFSPETVRIEENVKKGKRDCQAGLYRFLDSTLHGDRGSKSRHSIVP